MADASAAKAIDWLLDGRISECADERNYLNAFVLVWLSGHPDIRVELEPDGLPFLRTFPELLFPSLFAMAKARMTTVPGERSTTSDHVAAIEAVLDLTRGEKKYRSDEVMKELRKLRKREQLATFVSGRLAKIY